MITTNQAFTIMKNEMKCQLCEGSGTVPDTTPDFTDDIQCPSCSGKGVIIENVIMTIIDTLSDGWEATTQTSFSEKDIKEYLTNSLVKALLLLMALADVLSIDCELVLQSKDKAILNDPFQFLSIMTNLTHASMNNISGPNDGHNYSTAIEFSIHELLCYFRNKSIDIEKHIQAYQKANNA